MCYWEHVNSYDKYIKKKYNLGDSVHHKRYALNEHIRAVDAVFNQLLHCLFALELRSRVHNDDANLWKFPTCLDQQMGDQRGAAINKYAIVVGYF